ncbi:Bax inhibitor-1/YccA family protein [Pyruvatibacter sp.]|uniref:Bax inhibitor-1/YccA family protein n=1 Tax=Pyruvatibacter sp. TaxID=1981328 RepID=UPI0032F07637
MADYDSEVLRSRGATAAHAADIDAGLRSYMLRVYNYMAGGVLLSAVVAYFAAASGLYMSIAQTPLIWVVMLAPLGMVFFLSFRIHKMSVGTAQISFWAFAALMGLSLSYILLAFTGASVVQVFLITSAMFGSLSLWGYTTKRDISGWGSFLFMGLIGIIIAMIVNIFLASSALQFAISVIGVLVFAGLTAYDTQQIKEMYDVNDDGTVSGRKAIMGALRLYLDFINLFIMLMQLFGNRE